MSYRARKTLAAVLLLAGLPVYALIAVGVIGQFGRPPFLLELAIYAVLGVVWALPFKWLFKGIAQPDPDAGPEAPDAGPERDGAPESGFHRRTGGPT